VKRFLQRALGWVERRVFAQVHAQLGQINDRLDTVSTRLDEVQAVVEAGTARAAASTEQALGIVESDARTARRFEAIERMLGAAPPGNR
jgi:division protein CdvB (Snf7/Vps24/ESCRT-III family)